MLICEISSKLSIIILFSTIFPDERKYDKKNVKGMLEDGSFRPDKPTDRYKKLHQSDVWQVGDLIYDSEDERVLHWYGCSKCQKIKNIVLKKAGNGQLTRHVCFEKFKERILAGNIRSNNDSDLNEEMVNNGDRANMII